MSSTVPKRIQALRNVAKRLFQNFGAICRHFKARNVTKRYFKRRAKGLLKNNLNNF